MPLCSRLNRTSRLLKFCFSQRTDRSEEDLAFLGRIDPEKGPDVAIRVAHAAGLPLRIAAKVPRDKPAISKRQLKLSSKETARIRGRSERSRKVKTFSAKRLDCCFPSVGLSRSVL
jgi:glycosyltransferase involved in cell wall biosynthesis